MALSAHVSVRSEVVEVLLWELYGSELSVTHSHLTYYPHPSSKWSNHKEKYNLMWHVLSKCTFVINNKYQGVFKINSLKNLSCLQTEQGLIIVFTIWSRFIPQTMGHFKCSFDLCLPSSSRIEKRQLAYSQEAD